MIIKVYLRIAVATALIASFSLIKIPLFLIPMTLQVFIVSLLALTIKKLAIYAYLLYLLIGLLGFPVFANGGGISYIFSLSFGYLIGMLLMSYILSNYTSENKLANILIVIFSLLPVYLIGMTYFALLQKFYYHQSFTYSYLFKYLFLIFLPNDLISLALSLTISKRIKTSLSKILTN